MELKSVSQKYTILKKSYWSEVKQASENLFDAKLKNVIDICKPDLLLILDWNFHCKDWLKRYYENEWAEKIEDTKNYFYCARIMTPVLDTFVCKLDHPTHMLKKDIVFADKILRIIEHYNIFRQNKGICCRNAKESEVMHKV